MAAADQPADENEENDENDESELERWQRNFMELLQELRVAQTGVQILFAFLLTVPFTTRFKDASTFAEATYMVALLSAAAASAFLIAPVAYHRILFRQGRKPKIVVLSHRTALGGLALLVVAVTSSVMLAADLVLSRSGAIAAATAIGVLFVGLWFVVPWTQRSE